MREGRGKDPEASRSAERFRRKKLQQPASRRESGLNIRRRGDARHKRNARCSAVSYRRDIKAGSEHEIRTRVSRQVRLFRRQHGSSSDQQLWETDLTAVPGLVEAVSRDLERIERTGPRAALAAHLDEVSA